MKKKKNTHTHTKTEMRSCDYHEPTNTMTSPWPAYMVGDVMAAFGVTVHIHCIVGMFALCSA